MNKFTFISDFGITSISINCMSKVRVSVWISSFASESVFL